MTKPSAFARMIFCIATLFGSAVAVAADGGIDEVYAALSEAMPNLKKENISASPVPGIYEVSRGMSFFYATADGRYVFSGDLIDVRDGRSVTENNRKSMRLLELAKTNQDDMIIFPAKHEKYQITVFTDIDCGYCRKLHREIDKYNAKGITVRYMFYPRSGPNTPSFKKAENVWCAADRNDAMTTAKQGGEVDAKACENPVRQHFETGQALGVRGTPAIVLQDGGMQPGYVPADRLIKILEQGS